MYILLARMVELIAKMSIIQGSDTTVIKAARGLLQPIGFGTNYE